MAVSDPLPEPRDLRRRARPLMARDETRLRRRIDRLRRERNPQRRRAELERILEALEAAESAIAARRDAVPEVAFPDSLPIAGALDELRVALRDHQVVVVAGETGSGKSTQLPKLCLELGRGVRGMIGHTQPRRLAARSIAARVAEELDVVGRDVVASSVRFDDQAADGTLVRVMTDGLLLAEIDRDPLLRRYDTIIVDEAHERSLNVDVLLGYLAKILPRRRDLRLIVTSATIDTGRFATHFDAPVVTVSGRGHPVELRYRPLDVDGEEPVDPPDAAAAAVRELLGDTSGDVLVFCSGEREITETIEAIGALGLSGVEALPLHARLPAAEQRRIFEPHELRRVIVATNVAETSLTVPGIRAVVDGGTARISRTGRRSKVQRLPIEPISQASAEQRAGRCGRIGPGICVRLYAEDDLDGRPPFTEPEILRTNLASVVLRLRSLGITELSDFPFLDPPDRRAVLDAERLLVELGAVEVDDRSGALTSIGRRLARLPVDPRLGRMVLQAEREGCLDGALVVVAGLSIVDPRERWTGAPEDDPHAVDREDGSDVLAWLRLWRRIDAQRRELGRSAFRRWCRRERLHHGRVLEWWDLVRQLHRSSDAIGLRRSSGDDTDALHRSVLAGALTQVGVLDRRTGDYRGVRGTRFRLAKESAVARRSRWVVAVEIVDTGRPVARTIARVRPEWIEELGEHLLEHSYGEPWWEPDQGSAMVHERVALDGLDVVRQRRIQVGRVDPARARSELIVHGLARGEWRERLDVLGDNRQVVEEVVRIARRARRPELLVDDRELVAFYDERLPATVTTAAELHRWWRRARRREPDRLTLTTDALLARSKVEIDLTAYPEHWTAAGVELPLEYDFDRTSAADGVSVRIPVAVLDRLRPEPFAWHVPGHRAEVVEAVLRAQPKDLRRELLPIAEHAAAIAAEHGPDDGPLREVVERAVGRRTGVALDIDALGAFELPSHLRLTFVVVDAAGDELGRGDDLAALQRQHTDAVEQAFAGAAEEVERTGLTRWELDELPRSVTVERFGGVVTAFPALVDEGTTVGVRILPTEAHQTTAMRAGTRRLLALSLANVRRHLLDPLPDERKLGLASTVGERLPELLDDLVEAAVDVVVDRAGGPAWSEPAWRGLRDRARREVAEIALVRIDAVAALLVEGDRLRERVDALGPGAPGPALDDVRRQLVRLTGPGRCRRAGLARLGELPRYLDALDLRLDRIRGASERDLDHLRAVQALELRLDDLVARHGDLLGPAADDLRWSLEELRVSLWAQRLGTSEKVSVPRIERRLDELDRSVG
ncbi:MAG: ATP-dependent RNA helicase HrpA [Actinomycetota bacterium]